MTSGIVHASSWVENTPIFKDLSKETKRDILRDFSLEFMNIENGAVSARQANPDLYVLPNGAYMHVDYRQGLTEEELRKPGVDVKAT
ncbi:Nuclear hormone receptor [Aphelenchoides avenae]|nr:Nuclear hormone receptor [Aphelenchus avenae]